MVTANHRRRLTHRDVAAARGSTGDGEQSEDAGTDRAAAHEHRGRTTTTRLLLDLVHRGPRVDGVERTQQLRWRIHGLRCRQATEPTLDHALVLDQHGFSEHRLAACGYSLGAKFTPSWMDWPMFYEANPWVIEPGMVLFAHMILMDSETETALCLGRTSIVAQGGAQPVNLPDLDLAIR